MNRLIKFVILDIIKNKTILGYTLLLSAFAWSIFGLEDNSTKGVLTLLNIMLLIVPLVSIIFSTIYIYNSSEFIDLMVSQPVKRNKIWISLYIGLCLAQISAFIVGVGVPLLLFVPLNIALSMMAVGCMISIIFIAIAFFASAITHDKSKGIGISIMLWLYFALLFDGIVLFILFQFADYPIEHIMVGITMLSPIDMARILILLQLDVSALLGYTGAIFNDFFGTILGALISSIVLLLWAILPFYISLRIFNKKDL
ncbi:MAG: ABC transporter permease subunit [Bacteroidetes bacterium]|nr:ABC transporter permease subunit [Bacteroidota bacterium]